MDRTLRWRSFLLFVFVALSIYALLPSLASERLPSWLDGNKIRLDTDLQGGIRLLYTMDISKAVDDKAAELKRDMDTELAKINVKAKVTTPHSPLGAVNVIVEKAADLPKVKGEFLKPYDEIVSDRTCPAEVKQAVCLLISTDFAERLRESALSQAVQIIRDRLGQKGVALPNVVRKGQDILVEIPGLDATWQERTKSIIARTAKLEFKMMEEDTEKLTFIKQLFAHVKKELENDDSEAKKLDITVETNVATRKGSQYTQYILLAQDRQDLFSPEEARKRPKCYHEDNETKDGQFECKREGREVLEAYLAKLGETDKKFRPDDEHEIGFGKDRFGDKEYWRTFYLKRAVELSGSEVESAQASWDPTSGNDVVVVNFTRWGGKRFGELSTNNVGKRMAIILDNKVNSDPFFQGPILGGSAQITVSGRTPKERRTEANDLVAVLTTGSLQAPLILESESKIGPLLGKDAVRKAQFIVSRWVGAGDPDHDGVLPNGWRAFHSGTHPQHPVHDGYFGHLPSGAVAAGRGCRGAHGRNGSRCQHYYLRAHTRGAAVWQVGAWRGRCRFRARFYRYPRWAAHDRAGRVRALYVWLGTDSGICRYVDDRNRVYVVYSDVVHAVVL